MSTGVSSPEARGDSVWVVADSARAAVDTAAARVDTAAIDPVEVWRFWKDISLAIALRDLDGPNDILEKAEIIEDRIDGLLVQGRQIDQLLTEWIERQRFYTEQLEVLEDLADIQPVGDPQRQQRLHDLRADLRRTEMRLRLIQASRGDLTAVREGWKKQAQSYREKADSLRYHEERDR